MQFAARDPFFSGKNTLPVVKVADLSPIHFSEKIPPQMVPMDLNIGDSMVCI